MKIKELIFFTLIFSFVLLYELSAFFTVIGLSSINMIKNIDIITILLILINKNKSHCLRLKSHIKVFICILSVLIFLQIIFGIASNFISPIITIIFFYVTVKFSDKNFIKSLYTSIVIITIISSIPILYFYLLYGYYARTEIIFDKSMQTFLFGFCYTMLLLELSHNNIKNKLFIFSILVYLLIINIVILQSKTSIFVFLINLLFMSILKFKDIKIAIQHYWKFIAIIAIILPFLPIEWELPDTLKQATNKLTGKTVFVLEKNLKEDTYEIRELIVDKTIEIVKENPIFGAGFGNMTTALKSTKTGVTQGESQIVDLALEGGITYLTAFAILTLPILLLSLKRIYHSKSDYPDEFVFYQLLGFLILCIGNEMLSSLGWIFLGTLIYIFYTKSTITIFNKHNDTNQKRIKRIH